MLKLEVVTGSEQFCRIVSAQRWRGVLIQMLTACFDGGAKETLEYNVITVAGFASFAGMWTEFEQRWQARLTQDGLPYFHAGDFAHSAGVFTDGWKKQENKRRALLNDLFEIIQDCGLRKFGCILKLDDFTKAQERHDAVLDAYAFAGTAAVEDFQAFAKSEGVNRNVRYVFEKGDPEDDLRAIFQYKGFSDPDFAWSKPHTDNKGFKHDPFIGLQAAGWIAYEYYLDAERLLYGKPTSRWALEKFETLPGFITLKHGGSVMPNIPDLRKFLDSVREASKRIDKLAPKVQ